MKIVQALGWYYPESVGGTEIYVAALARLLRRAGHEVIVAVPEPGAAGPRAYEHEGARVFRYPIPARPTRAEVQGLAPVRGTGHLDAWLAAERPEVVHVHTFVTGLALREVRTARATGARVIMTTHASSLGYVCPRGTLMRWGRVACDAAVSERTCTACALDHAGVPGGLARVLAAIPVTLSRAGHAWAGPAGTAIAMRDLVRRQREAQVALVDEVDALVVLTESARAAVAGRVPRADRVLVNRLGIDQAHPVVKPPVAVRPTRAPITVGYAGRFEAIKGVDDLVRAVRSLPPDVPVRVVIRGPASAAAGSPHSAASLAAGDDRIVFGAPLPHAEMPAWLASLDLLCCPSRCAEGGPTVAIEAHACGTPVIGTRIGGLAELVADGVNGRLVAPGDWRALARVLAEIAAQPAATIDRWRTALPPARTMEEVTADYLRLYGAGAGDVTRVAAVAR